MTYKRYRLSKTDWFSELTLNFIFQQVELHNLLKAFNSDTFLCTIGNKEEHENCLFQFSDTLIPQMQ